MIYYQLPLNSSSATIIFAGIGRAAERSLGEYALYYKDISAARSWEIHLVLLTSTIATWRPYLVYLGSEVNAQVDRANYLQYKG